VGLHLDSIPIINNEKKYYITFDIGPERVKFLKKNSIQGLYFLQDLNAIIIHSIVKINGIREFP